MNVTQFPTAPIHSTQLTGTLSGCGAQCCPLGYSCQNQQCILGTDAAHASSTTSLASSPRTTTSAISSSVTSTATVSATSPSVVPALSSSLPVSSAHCKLFPGSAVAAGFFPGVALGALLAVLSTICFARRRDAKLANEEEDKPRVNPIVSEPIYHGESMATRTDFLRRASKSLYSPHVKSLFNRSPTFVQRDSPDGIGRSLKSPNTPPRTPRTPESRIGLRHEPSMESIKIYSPPDGRVGRGTTFTDLMANAGFRHDDAFLSGRLNRDSVTTRNLT
ncbi:MAG: hypothetical protein MMC33_000500 [Icmadophila ericetorum]|nr:hypothetical protein [Icmadophila ericetorum]